VDGGGTKTAFALFDAQGRQVLLREGAGSNHENLAGSFDEAAEILWEGVRALLAQAGIGIADVGFCLMGLAGVDHPFQYRALLQRLQGYGLARLELCNDGFLPIKAGSHSGAAVGLNCGTGTCCNAIDSRGRRVQLAGLGGFSGDVGNGVWIATQAFRLVYDACILGLEHTLLKELLFSAYSFREAAELPVLLAGLVGEDADRHLRTLIRLFFTAAEAGDVPALRLVEQMALRGAQLIAAHIRTLDFPARVEVVLSGSIHTKLRSKPYLEALREKAEALSGRALDFTVLDVPPVQGCIRWILQEYAEPKGAMNA
jgi:N-acetylglucosamine kinase-like BadF-type ATPase